MLKQKHQVFVALLGAADAIAVAAACYAAWGARMAAFDEALPESWETFFRAPLVLFAVPIVLYSMLVCKLYRPRRDRSITGELGQVVKACVVALVLVVVTLWAVGSDFLTQGVRPSDDAWYLGQRLASEPARYQLAILALFMPALLSLHRMGFRLTLRWMRSRGWNLRHVAIIGVGRLGQITARTLQRNSWTGISVSYFVSHHQTTRRTTCLGSKVQGGLEDLERTLEDDPVDAVYLALPARQAAEMPDLLRVLERHAVDVRIVPDVHPRYLPQSMTVGELEGMPILSYRESPMNGLGGLSKRVLDVLGACFALTVFSPLLLLVAGLVRLSGPGPIIFKQERVSLGGEVFRIWKFRTMHHVDDERETGPRWTSRGDPRITPIGRFLRSTSLDELPQLFNVIRGDMSLVGPRPERPELITQFREDWRGYMLRQHVKAGITGWAQINGLRGDTSLRKRLQYDLFYIRHWSLWFDLRILLATPFRGFVHRNAI